MTPHAAHATGSARGTSGSEDATSSISGARRFADGLKRLLALFHYFAYGGIAAIMSITWMALLVASVLQFQSETGLRFYDSLAAGFHALNTLALFSTVLGVLLGWFVLAVSLGMLHSLVIVACLRFGGAAVSAMARQYMNASESRTPAWVTIWRIGLVSWWIAGLSTCVYFVAASHMTIASGGAFFKEAPGGSLLWNPSCLHMISWIVGKAEYLVYLAGAWIVSLAVHALGHFLANPDPGGLLTMMHKAARRPRAERRNAG